jgi:hypothetical protein
MKYSELHRAAPKDPLSSRRDSQASRYVFEPCRFCHAAGVGVAQYGIEGPHSCRLSMAILCCIVFCASRIARKLSEVLGPLSVGSVVMQALRFDVR